jgi:hypothetical protein
MLHAMEGLIRSLVGIEHACHIVPSVRVVVLRSPLHQLCYPILNIPIQASSELHYD